VDCGGAAAVSADAASAVVQCMTVRRHASG
jgi:hypothetical protein